MKSSPRITQGTVVVALAHTRKRPFQQALLTSAIGVITAGYAGGLWAQDTNQAQGQNQEQNQETVQLDVLSVTAEAPPTKNDRTSYTAASSTTATKLDLSLRETPQSVTVVTRRLMEDFALTDVNQALNLATGVSVQSVETDRTYYTARGFDVTNFQLDGIGVPLVYGNIGGSLDSYLYDRIEVIRGANGLMSGLGNPSATINFVRKRPTDEFEAAAGVMVGSWDKRRVEADLSGPLNDSGTVRGRLVAAYLNQDSYLDRYSLERSALYGVVDAQVTDTTLLTIGHSQQQSNPNSPLWGALPLYNTDGRQIHHDESTSTAADWAFWDGDRMSSFIELVQQLGNGWQGRAVVTRNENEEGSELFYVYGTPNPTTPGSDLYAYPSRYNLDYQQVIADFYVSGPFQLAGREHELVLGASWAKSKLQDESNYGQGIGTEIPALDDWNGDYPKPSFDAGTDGSRFTDRQRGLYSAARFSVTDQLGAITGMRLVDGDTTGESYGVSKATSYEDKLVPYAGLTYDLDDTYTLYGSYTEIFNPQAEEDINRNRLAPIEGANYELGIKGEFDRGLNATFAVFKTQQSGVAEEAGTIPGSLDPYSVAVDFESLGYEIDVAGEVAPGLELIFGFTHLKIEDEDGDRAATYVPKRLLKLATTYQLPFHERLKVGASLTWQSDIERTVAGVASTGANAGSPIVVKQDSYAVLNLMARYDLTDNLSTTINLNNVTDEKYIASLYWDQGLYGAPRHVTASLNWTY